MEMMDEVVNLDTSSAEAAKSHQETTNDYVHIFAEVLSLLLAE